MPRQNAQNIITRRMAERVIDEFEMIEIDQHQSDRSSVFAGFLYEPLQPMIEGSAIEQPSEIIGFATGFESLCALSLQRDIAGKAKDPGSRPILVLLIEVSGCCPSIEACCPVRYLGQRISSISRIRMPP